VSDTSFNHAAAEKLREYARLLNLQGSNPFRVNAYLRASQTLDALTADVRETLSGHGVKGLVELPFIGAGLAQAINEMAKTGRLDRLDRLRGTTDPETLLRTVPGIGAKLAHDLHDALDIGTLEELEIAAHDGRLERMAGVGPRRAAAIRASVASLLARIGPVPSAARDPAVSVLLDVDREYRERAAADDLPRIAPRRLNPRREAWLPILHTERGPRHFTALFSNTPKAHELGRTHDWVVIYSYDEDHRENRHTVVTETRGPLAGRRVVRGREGECSKHYGVAAYSVARRSA
jgi:hypothetical protein